MTRVELHDADEDDYQTLHAAMENEGFSRTITSGQNVVYRLPTAEYDRQGNLTRQQVLESAKNAAGRTGCKFGVIVTESQGSTWHGLKKSRRDAQGTFHKVIGSIMYDNVLYHALMEHACRSLHSR